MRDINFLLDEISEQDKKEVKDIIKRIKTKSQKTPKDVIFLRRFTLSLMKQYAIKKSVPKSMPFPSPLQIRVKEVQSGIPNPVILAPKRTDVPEQLQLIPKMPSDNIPEPVRLTEVKSEIPVPAPEPLRLTDLHNAAPAPPIPKPIEDKAITNAIKKELSVPMPN